MRANRGVLALSGVLLTAVLAAGLPPGTGAATVGEAPTAERDLMGRMGAIVQVTGARALWACGHTGAGVDVAVIDTGVAPVAGSGAIVNGVDLSFDPISGNPAFVDGYGHGTHLASLVNGRDPGWAPPPASECPISGNARRRLAGLGSAYVEPAPDAPFAGMAPEARVVNVKVGAADGAVDVSQVIAGIDWVIAHRAADDRNIKVLLLAYGTVATQAAGDDPLALATQRAIDAGITVVVSAGNDGSARPDLANPAINPNVIAVGAADLNGSADPTQWTVADFADRGNSARAPDIIAPGVSVQGLRVPNGFADTFYPEGRDGRFSRASGTSQAAAIVAGWAALVQDAKPNTTPAQMKKLLAAGAGALLGDDESAGAGMLGAGDGLAPALTTATNSGLVALPAGQTGTLQGARGPHTMIVGGVPLLGETTVWGQTWTAQHTTQTTNRWVGTTWLGRDMRNPWAGTDYAGRPFTARAWSDPGAYRDTWSPSGTWTGQRWEHKAWEFVRWGAADWEFVRWGSGGWNFGNWRVASWEFVRWGTGEWGFVRWGTGGWEFVRWGTGGWDFVRWGGTDWTFVRWGADQWGFVRWGGSDWEFVRWGANGWEFVRWGGSDWEFVRWGATGWEFVRWGANGWEFVRWGANGWEFVRWGMADWV